MTRIESVSFRHRATLVLQDISLTIPKGGVVALIGPNGAGKSTLLSLMARLQPLQAGTIEIDGLPVDTTPGRQLAKVVAILRQDTMVASRLTVRELVGFGRFPHGRGRLTGADRAIVEAAIAASTSPILPTASSRRYPAASASAPLSPWWTLATCCSTSRSTISTCVMPAR